MGYVPIGQLFMINRAWLDVLFDLWENYSDVLKAKNRKIERLASFSHQRAQGMDAERACEELIDALVERQAITTVIRDVKRAYSMLPITYKKLLALRYRDKLLFWQIAKRCNCSLRNVMYKMNRALDDMSTILSARGYSDSVLKELFEGDAMVEGMLEYARAGS